MKIFNFIIKFIIGVFALIGFGLSAAYAAVGLHLTDTKGIIDEQANIFWKNGQAAVAFAGAQKEPPHFGFAETAFFSRSNYCAMKAVKSGYPAEFNRIYRITKTSQSLAQKNLDGLVSALSAAQNQKFLNTYRPCDNDNTLAVSEKDFKELAGDADIQTESPYVWANSEEWAFFKAAILKDKDILNRVEQETGIKKRVLVAELMAEQMRLFYSDRPAFKSAIAPLKVLGSMTQFSWGVFGIKPETAMKIEDNLKDPSSPFYPGPEYSKLLDFKTANVWQERFDRITNYKDNYYSCLYAALYNKEVISQWKRSDVDISNRPEILATLFNIGFVHSVPNSEPQVGGAELDVSGAKYSFGGLAAEFYYSGELLEEFPQ